jgi:mono/diheme cytochrome c family protein
MESSRILPRCVAPFLSVFVIASCTSSPPAASSRADIQVARGSREQVLLGRQLVLGHDCGGCHGGQHNPAGKGWLAGLMSPTEPFHIGACTFDNPTAKPCYITRPRNLTPDNATGLGRFTERQIFNALRYGLRPEDTPDVEITSMTPGQGNFPLNPHYLAPPMPWPSWRHMADQELWAIAAYLRHGVKPVTNTVAESDGPPDFWAGVYAKRNMGPYPALPFPTANEQLR